MEIRWRFLFRNCCFSYDRLRPLNTRDNWWQSFLYGICNGECDIFHLIFQSILINYDFCRIKQVGIPLGLVMFQSIGERLNKFVSVVIRRVKTYIRCKQIEATETNLMIFNGMLSSIIITTGAAVFSRYEGWSYFDSFYYCFVTLTTIGYE